MIKVKGNTLRKVRVTSRTLDRVERSAVAAALGAEQTEASVSVGQSPIALFGLRQGLAERLRSSGGRPSLGVGRRQKIPLDDADWQLLCKLSEMLSDEVTRPTPGQVASELLRQRLRQVCAEVEQSNPDRLRAELGKGAKRRATG